LIKYNKTVFTNYKREKFDVRTVAGFLKDKLPAGMAGQVDEYLTGKRLKTEHQEWVVKLVNG